MNEIHDEQPPTVTDNQNAAGAENREFRIAGAEAENIADAQLVHDADRRKSVAMALVEALESLRVFGGFDRQALRASVTGPCSMSAVDSFLRARLADGTLRRLLDGIYAFSSHEQTHRPRRAPRYEVGYRAGYQAGYQAALNDFREKPEGL